MIYGKVYSSSLQYSTLYGSYFVHNLHWYWRLLTGEEFASLRENFLAQHCHVFDDVEENKLEYMDIYKQYVSCL